MSSQILNSMGFGNLDIAYIFIAMIAIIVILFIIVMIQITKMNKLSKRFSKFMQGKDAKSLEQNIIGLFEDHKFLKISTESNKKDIKTLYKNLTYAYQKVGIVKYDAFKEMGGKLSFSLVLLNENNDGFVMNSVHSSDGCYSYTKEIKNGQCSIDLGEEEKNALEEAMNCNLRKSRG